MRLKDAAVEGLVFGVKWGVAIVVLAVILSLLMGDYAITRQRAMNGQQAFDAIVRSQQPQAK